MPYRKQEPTYSGSATRFYEHLAACRPILSSRGFHELLSKEPLLKLVTGGEDAAREVELLKSKGFRDGFEELRWRASQEGTWLVRARALVAAATRAIEGRTAGICGIGSARERPPGVHWCSAMKVVTVHRGARDSYQVARALQEAGLLERLVTDIYWPADRGWARRIESGLPRRVSAALSCRHAAGVPADAVTSCRLSGVSSLMASKAPWLPDRWEREAVRWCDRSLGRRAGRIATRKNAALLSYSYYAHSAFSHYEGDGPRILFQLHPHAASVRSILWRERELHPDCASSLDQEWELALPETDLRRLVEEAAMAQHWIVASSYTKRTLTDAGVPAERIAVIPYGIDLNRFSPRREEHGSRGPLRLLFVGTLGQRKGIKYLVQAVEMLPPGSVELTVCGRPVDDLALFRQSRARIHLHPSIGAARPAGGVPVGGCVCVSVPGGRFRARSPGGHGERPSHCQHRAHGGAGSHPAWPGGLHRPGRERLPPGGNHREFPATARERPHDGRSRAESRGMLHLAELSPGSGEIRRRRSRSRGCCESQVMFIALIWAVVIILGVAIWYAYAGSGDVFHPLMLTGPMMAFIYAWMPYKLDSIGGLAGFFQRDQLDYIQQINLCGVACFVLGCLSVGARRRPAVSGAGSLAGDPGALRHHHGLHRDGLLGGGRHSWHGRRSDGLHEGLGRQRLYTGRVAAGLPGVSTDSRGQRAAGIPFSVRLPDGSLYRAVMKVTVFTLDTP